MISISVNSDKLFLIRQARYLGLWVKKRLSWDDQILELCRKMYYYFHIFRRLRKILSTALLLNIYKAYVQSKTDYRLSIWGCTTEVNLNSVQRIQNLLARIIGEAVRSLKLQTIRERRDHFLCIYVQMYSWPRTPLSDYWRQHACWYTWLWYKRH